MIFGQILEGSLGTDAFSVLLKGKLCGENEGHRFFAAACFSSEEVAAASPLLSQSLIGAFRNLDAAFDAVNSPVRQILLQRDLRRSALGHNGSRVFRLHIEVLVSDVPGVFKIAQRTVGSAEFFSVRV